MENHQTKFKTSMTMWRW